MSTDIKKIITLMLVSIFLVTLIGVNVSALDFTHTKSYDEETKTITIKSFPLIGRDISTIQLKSKLNERLGAGYQNVSIFEIDLFDDTYTDAFNKMEFYNLRNNKLINRQFDYKYLTTELMDVNDYKESCNTLANGTKYCEQVISGTHQEEKEVWKDYTTNLLIKGKVTIGIFTDVQVGDYIEWIPTFFGKEIDEWAVWTQDLDVDLVYSYEFDGNSGVLALNNITENTNGTITDLTRNANGIINGGINFNEDGGDDINITGITSTTEQYTFEFWLNYTGDNEAQRFLADYESGRISFDITNLKVVLVGDGALNSGTGIQQQVWTQIIVTLDAGNNNKSIWLNGTRVASATYGGLNVGGNMRLDNRFSGGNPGVTGIVDNVRMWERVLTDAEIIQLYSNGASLQINATVDDPPVVNLNTPINTSNFTTNIINFGGVVSDDIILTNVSLIIDDVIIETNISGINNSNYTFTQILADGNFTWTYEACDNSSQCTNGTARTFSVDALPSVSLISPANATTTTTALVPFNGTVTTPGNNLINVSLIINDIVNETNSSGIEGNYNFSVLLSQQILTWNYEACNTFGCVNGTERTLEIHLTPVTIDIIEPTGTEDYILLGSNQTITWNITEPGVNLSEHVVECLYTYNGVTYNVTDICITTNTTSFPYSNGINFLNFSVVEEFGIETNVNLTWEYKLIEINNTFNNETTEGNLETFLAYTQILSGLTVSSVSLIYNNTEYTGESFIVGSNTVFRKTDLLVDDLSTNANLSFYWTVTLSDSTEINLSTQNQTVYVLGIDDCSVFTNEILNFTSVDEETQVQLSNVTIETATNIYTSDRSQLILNYSNLSNTNPTRVCLNINLTAVSNYSLDVIVRYENPISANEYYNIVNLELTEDTGRQDIILYDLNISDSTEFQLTFIGSDFLPVENALVYVDRQYISENTFKTVELPKTDYNGQSVLHLVRNDVIYNIRIIKDGVVLGSFENLVAFCDDFTIGDCNIELNAFDSVQNIFNQDTNLGIIFTSPTYNETSNIISFNFLTDDGTAKTVTMNVTRNDIFGNRSICETSLTSSGGTLTCAINPDLDETILITSIYVEGEQVALDQVKLDSSNYGVAGYLILFVFALSLIFMFAPTGKTGVLISMVLSIIGATGLGLVSGELIGVGASGIWLLVIVIVGIYKLNKEKQQ